MIFLNQLINGLHVGSIYALIALGYTMVYGIVKLINFAHGDIIMVGAYAVLLSLTVLHWPVWAAVLLAMAVCAVFGMVIERVAYRPLRSAPRISALITAIGVSLLLENAAMLLMSANPRSVPALLPTNPVQIGPLRIAVVTLVTIGAVLLLCTLLQLFIRKTRMGKAMRAVSEDMGTARLMGINVNITISITFAIGSALAGMGAVLYCAAYPQVQPFMGSMLGLKAFIAAVLGGIGMIPGAIIGAFIMGIAESMVKGFVSSQLADAVVFGILIVVLLVKPSGLLGKVTTEKV